MPAERFRIRLPRAGKGQEIFNSSVKVAPFERSGSEMAREKIEIKRKENRAARHVTFCKRRQGLIKKARELSVLCDADVALIVFSTTGKPFKYCSTSIKTILEKYEKYSNTTSTINEQFIHKEIQLENQEVIRIRQRIEDLNRTLSQLHGKDLEGLNMTELEQIENKLEIGLRQVCSKKDESLTKEIYELQKQLDEIQSCQVEDDIAEEPLCIDLLATNNHSQSSESTFGNHYSRDYNLQKANSIIDNEASDTSLQLGLSI